MLHLILYNRMDPETVSLRRAANRIMENGEMINMDLSNKKFGEMFLKVIGSRGDWIAIDILNRIQKGKLKTVSSEDMAFIGAYFARRGFLEDPLDYRGINTVAEYGLYPEEGEVSNVFNRVNPLHTAVGRIPIEWAKPHEKDAWARERRAREDAVERARALVRVPLILDEEPEQEQEPDLKPSRVRDATLLRTEFRPIPVRKRCRMVENSEITRMVPDSDSEGSGKSRCGGMYASVYSPQSFFDYLGIY